MAQTALLVLPRFLLYVRNLLKTGMKVTAYNHHARLLSSRALGRFPATSLLRSEEPTLSCNQFSTFDFLISGLRSTTRGDKLQMPGNHFSPAASKCSRLSHESQAQSFSSRRSHPSRLLFQLPPLRRPNSNSLSGVSSEFPRRGCFQIAPQTSQFADLLHRVDRTAGM